jgi:hypothetical protein
MGWIDCPSCAGYESVCGRCAAPWPLSLSHRRQHGTVGRPADPRCKAGPKYDRTECPNHVPTLAKCDFCGEEQPAGRGAFSGHSTLPRGWELVDVGRSRGLGCEDCHARLNVAIDALWQTGFLDAFALVESRACAFAFHLGQYEDAARAAPVRLRDWRSAEFIDPTTKGRYAWGRWSEVRRDTALRDRRPELAQ